MVLRTASIRVMKKRFWVWRDQWCTCGAAEELVVLWREGEPQSWFVKRVAHVVCVWEGRLEVS